MESRIVNSQALVLKPVQDLKRPAKALPLAKAPQSDLERQKLKTACDGFEALFMQQMLKQMRATIPKDAMFGGGTAEQIYTDMLDAQLSKEMAHSGGLGISRLLFEYMTTAQGLGGDTND